jgi:hypothetical protein
MSRPISRLVPLTLAVLLLGVAPSAMAQGGFQHDFRICIGEFALCAASTCTPTGETIEVNGPDGTKPSFPSAECLCPIFKGPAIADLNGGNMEGSCDPPFAGLGIWSLYWPESNIPQQIHHWSRLPPLSKAPGFLCPPGNADTAANCFSFACVRAGKTANGVELAKCTCPLGESLDGTPVSADQEFFTQAGQCDDDICSKHPIFGPLPFSGQGGQCFVIPDVKLKTRFPFPW